MRLVVATFLVATRVPVRTRCRTRRFIDVPVRFLLHRGETKWQQRKEADVKRAAHAKAPESRAAPAARERAAASRPERAAERADARAVKRRALLFERKSRRARRLFCFPPLRNISSRIATEDATHISESIARSRAPRSARSAMRTPFPTSAPPAQTRCSPRDSNWDSLR